MYQNITAECTLPHWGKHFSNFLRGWRVVSSLFCLWEEQNAVPAIWFQPGCSCPPWLKDYKEFHLELPVYSQTKHPHRVTRRFQKPAGWLRKVKVVFISACNREFIHSQMLRSGFSLISARSLLFLSSSAPTQKIHIQVITRSQDLAFSLSTCTPPQPPAADTLPLRCLISAWLKEKFNTCTNLPETEYQREQWENGAKSEAGRQLRTHTWLN